MPKTIILPDIKISEEFHHIISYLLHFANISKINFVKYFFK